MSEGKAKEFIIDRLKKWVADVILMGITALAIAAFTPFWSKAGAIWAMPEVLSVLTQTVGQLSTNVRQLTGEDRVIRETGAAWVEEPVFQGENVILWLTIERTTLGRDCRLTEWVPLFTDETNVRFAGSRPNATVIAQQITDESTRLRIETIPPEILRPGRIELFLDLVYDCGGKTVPDRTSTVPYLLKKRES